MKDYRLLDRWVMNQDDPMLNLAMGEWYISEGQTAAAYTHYIKAAEGFDESNVSEKYHCLMMLAWIMFDAGDRWRGVFQYCRFAKALDPFRSEAYFMLAVAYKDYLERHSINEQDEWIQVYENSLIGIKVAGDKQIDKLIYFDGITELKAIFGLSLLKLNKLTELRDLLSVTDFSEVSQYYKNIVNYIYSELGIWNPYLGYHKINDLENYKYKFNNLDLIRHNHSIMMQDMMALTLMHGIPGKYLEIGFIDPVNTSNTKLLEELGWLGLSITNEIRVVNEFNSSRTQRALCLEPAMVDLNYYIKKWFGNIEFVDYLSLEFDPNTNYAILSNINLDQYKFKFITVKHDNNINCKINIRNRLERDYNLLIPDVYYRDMTSVPYQDWFVSKYVTDEEFIRISESIRNNYNVLISKNEIYTPKKLLLNN